MINMKKNTIRILGNRLLKKYNLKDWNIDFNNNKEYYGACNYQRKTIYISIYDIDKLSDTHIQDTILHEISHTLSGEYTGHRLKWIINCYRLGVKEKWIYLLNEFIELIIAVHNQ